MNGEKKSFRILWAVDAFSQDKRLLDKAVGALKALSQSYEGEVKIEPVFVMAPPQLYFPLDLYSYVAPDMREEAMKALMKLLERVKLPGILPPVVLPTDNLSLRGAVKVLMDFGHRSGADLIVATTLSKVGSTRFLFGSFAETLVLQADIPVFLISPKAKTPKKMSRVLFPTDLSDESKEVFRRVASELAARGGHATLFHEVEYLNRYAKAAFAPTPAYRKCVEQDLERRRHEIEAMATEARGYGAHVDVVVSVKGRRADESILSAAGRERFDAIAMASHAGTVTAAVLGSVTRAVLRGAACPVWVLHPGDRAAVTSRRSKTESRLGRRAVLS